MPFYGNSPVFTDTVDGLVPAPNDGGLGKVLSDDGTWVVNGGGSDILLSIPVKFTNTGSAFPTVDGHFTVDSGDAAVYITCLDQNNIDFIDTLSVLGLVDISFVRVSDSLTLTVNLQGPFLGGIPNRVGWNTVSDLTNGFVEGDDCVALIPIPDSKYIFPSIPNFTDTGNGLVPAPNDSGAGNVLSDDGTWINPITSGLPTGFSSTTGGILAYNSSIAGPSTVLGIEAPDVATSYLSGNFTFEDWTGLEIPDADTDTTGLLTDTDWDTFNNGATTAGTALQTITSDGPLSGDGTSASHLAISQSTTSTDGYLSSTDWNTFNNKQNAFSFVFGELPTGVIDGVNDTFVLAHTAITGTVALYLDGLRVNPALYSVVTDTITFGAAPTGSLLLADYHY